MSFSPKASGKKFSDRFGKVPSTKMVKKTTDPKSIISRGTTDAKGFIHAWGDIERMPIGKLKFLAISQLCAVAVLPYGDIPGTEDGAMIPMAGKECNGWMFTGANSLDGYVIRMIPTNRANKAIREQAVKQCLTNLGYNPDFSDVFLNTVDDVNCDLKFLQEACRIIFNNEPNLFASADSLKQMNAFVCEMKAKWEQKQAAKAANKKFEESTTVGSLFGDVLSQVKTVA